MLIPGLMLLPLDLLRRDDGTGIFSFSDMMTSSGIRDGEPPAVSVWRERDMLEMNTTIKYRQRAGANL